MKVGETGCDAVRRRRPPARRSPALAAAAGALSDSTFAIVSGGELLVSFDPAEAERAAVRGALAGEAASEALP